MRHRLHRTGEGRTVLTTFLDEMYGIGTLTDPHLDEYDGTEYTTPSLIDHDDGKENNGEE